MQRTGSRGALPCGVEGPSMTSMGPSPLAALPDRLSQPPPLGESELTPPAGTMAQGWALLLLLLLPRQLGVVLAVRAPGFGRSGARSLSPEENEFSEEEPVLVLSPEEPGRGPATIGCPRDCILKPISSRSPSCSLPSTDTWRSMSLPEKKKKLS